MANQITLYLKDKLNQFIIDYNVSNSETQRNFIKEQLQLYILNFIYHHAEYKNWTMYGGSALRICYNLERMSVDLDFEIDHEVTDTLLKNLKQELGNNFKKNYNIDSDLLGIKIMGSRGLRLDFKIANDLGIKHPLSNVNTPSNTVQVKIDLNHFFAPNTVVNKIPINENQLSFIIKTYNMSSLMSSKIVAVLNRGRRIVGKNIYEEKGRDLYDLLWYMNKKITPDLDYLIAKKVEVDSVRKVFDTLTAKVLNNEKTDDNLRQDLRPLFASPVYVENWVANWRDTYSHLLDGYKIYTVKNLEKIKVTENLNADIFTFTYYYVTIEDKLVSIICKMSDDVLFGESDLDIKINEKIKEKITFTTDHIASNKKLLQYANLFYEKIEKYFDKTNREMISDKIETPIIILRPNITKSKEFIFCNKDYLLSCELDDLLK